MYKSEAIGYLNFLTTLENLEILSFLGDFFVLHSKFQKKLQSDKLNIILLKRHLDDFTEDVSDLKNDVLLGGFEENLTTNLSPGNGDAAITLNSIEIHNSYSRRAANCERTLQYLRTVILDRFAEFLSVRFSLATDNLCEILLPSFYFNKNLANVRKVHELMAADLDATFLNLQFEDICKNSDLKNMQLDKLLIHLVETDLTNSYTEFKIVLARLLAATPHSADVERCISANNSLKSPLRSSMKLETENNVLFVHFNLPPLVDWKPEKAVIHWLTKKERRAHNLMVENESRRTKKRPFFNGVFFSGPSSEGDDDDDHDDEDVEHIQPSKRRCL